MSTIRISLAVYASLVVVVVVVAVASHLLGQVAGAESRLAAGQLKSYAILADHLYVATESSDLADNIKQVGWLLRQHSLSNEEIHKLVQAFRSLRSDTKNAGSFCGSDNLANLVRVAEGLRDGGNLAPKKITPDIIRLNSIVMGMIRDARKVCSRFLAEKWPTPWRPNFSDKAMRGRIVNLKLVAPSFLYEGYFGLAKHRQPDEFIWQATTMSLVILKGAMKNAHAIVPNEPKPLSTVNTTVISKQLDEYVYKPCREFVALSEARQVLVPFNDLIRSWHIVSSRLLDEFYKNKNVSRPEDENYHDYDREVRNLAYSYRACERFLATSKKELTKRISQYRVADQRKRN